MSNTIEQTKAIQHIKLSDILLDNTNPRLTKFIIPKTNDLQKDCEVRKLN